MYAVSVLLLAVIGSTSGATNQEQNGIQQAVVLEIYTKNITEFLAIKRIFSEVILNEVFKVCQENINKCKPVYSTNRSEYALTIVVGYPKVLTGITDGIIVAFYVHTTKVQESVLPLSTLLVIIKDSRSIITEAIGYQVGSSGRLLQLKSNTAPPTDRNNYHDETLLIFLGVFVGVAVLAILTIIIVCLLGQSAKEPELKRIHKYCKGQVRTVRLDANPSSKY